MVKRCSSSPQTKGPGCSPSIYCTAAHGNGQARQDKILRPLNSDFDLYSIGPDGLTLPSLAKPESRDDIVRARDGAFVGPASEFDPM